MMKLTLDQMKLRKTHFRNMFAEFKAASMYMDEEDLQDLFEEMEDEFCRIHTRSCRK